MAVYTDEKAGKPLQCGRKLRGVSRPSQRSIAPGGSLRLTAGRVNNPPEFAAVGCF
jgi:hypothetical protein